MLQDFIGSWGHFHSIWLAGWFLAVLLAMQGVLVVARDQIFLGAAVSEASALGVALGLWLTSTEPFHDVEWMRSDWFLTLLAGLSSIGAALLTSRGGSSGRESTEATTGWVFVAAASFAILLVSFSPHGTEAVHKLIDSSLLGSSVLDVEVLGVLSVTTAGFLLCYRRRLLLAWMDPEMAEACGLRVRLWSLVMCTILGMTVGHALRVGGMLYTFGCLILPALAAKCFCRTASSVFLAAPVVAIATCVPAFVLSNHWDLPPGQMAVACLSCVTAASFLWGRLRGR